MLNVINVLPYVGYRCGFVQMEGSTGSQKLFGEKKRHFKLKKKTFFLPSCASFFELLHLQKMVPLGREQIRKDFFKEKK